MPPLGKESKYRQINVKEQKRREAEKKRDEISDKPLMSQPLNGTQPVYEKTIFEMGVQVTK